MQCKSLDCHATVTIKPSKVTIAGRLTAPLTVRVTHGASIDRVGTVSFCKGSPTTLSCK